MQMAPDLVPQFAQISEEEESEEENEYEYNNYENEEVPQENEAY
jgi:hypothetical protein